MRRGIISAGNWLADTVKFIPTFPSPGNLVTIEKVEVGFGGCSHNVLVDLAQLETDIPLCRWLHRKGSYGRCDYG